MSLLGGVFAGLISAFTGKRDEFQEKGTNKKGPLAKLGRVSRMARAWAEVFTTEA